MLASKIIIASLIKAVIPIQLIIKIQFNLQTIYQLEYFYLDVIILIKQQAYIHHMVWKYYQLQIQLILNVFQII